MPTQRQINKLDLIRVGPFAIVPRLHQEMMRLGYATKIKDGTAELTAKGQEMVRTAIWIDIGAKLPSETKTKNKKRHA